jgi:nonribosomal peptide synthetase DhbF
LFCIHPGGGFSWGYSRLIRHLPDGCPIYGLQASGLIQREIFPDSVEDLAAYYLCLIREIQPSGPYNILGWSFGGLVAYAMATHLQSESQEIGMLALMDSFPNEGKLTVSNPDEMAGVGTAQLQEFTDALRREGHLLSTLTEGHFDTMKRSLKKSIQLASAFWPRRFDGDLLLFIPTREEFARSSETWNKYVKGQINLHHIECTHSTMMDPEPAGHIGTVLSAELTKQIKTR